jgi:hypothetical protein
MLVDLKVYELAALFIDDLIDEVPTLRPRREAAIDRLAAAIQQAAEGEYAALYQEWVETREYADCVDSGLSGDALTLDRDR